MWQLPHKNGFPFLIWDQFPSRYSNWNTNTMKQCWTPKTPFMLPSKGGVPFHGGCSLLALTDSAFLFTTLSKHRGSFLCSETSSGSRPIRQIQDPSRSHNKMYPRPTGWSDKVQQRQSAVLFNFAGFSFAKPNLYWFFLQRHLTCCIHSVGSLRITLLRWT